MCIIVFNSSFTSRPAKPAVKSQEGKATRTRKAIRKLLCGSSFRSQDRSTGTQYSVPLHLPTMHYHNDVTNTQFASQS